MSLVTYPAPWRQGTKVPQNIYDAEDKPVVMAPDAETAKRIIDGVNALAAAMRCGMCGELRQGPAR